MDARASGNVQVLGIGHLAAAVRLQLRTARAEELESPESHEPLVVACSDFPNSDSFRDANARALATRSRILFVVMAQPQVVHIGPLVAPDRPGCFECVRARRYTLRLPAVVASPLPCAPGGAGLVVRQLLATRATPYRGTPDRRAAALRPGGCRACRARG